MNNSKIDEALACFEGGCNCCQAILSIYGPDFGLSRDLALHQGTGFGGGIARHGDLCGAVNGAIMVMGLKYGMQNESDDSARERTYEFVSKFIKEFRKRHDSIQCRDLLGCDIGRSEGMATAKEKGLFKTLCPEYVRGAAEILEALIF